MFSGLLLGQWLLWLSKEGLSTAPTKEKGFKQLLRYSKNEDIRKELLQKKIYWNVLEVKSISTVWNYIGYCCSLSFLSSKTFPLQYQTLSDQILWFYFGLPWIFILVTTLLHLYNLFTSNTLKIHLCPYSQNQIYFKTGLNSVVDLCNSPGTRCINLLLIVSAISSASCAIPHFLARCSCCCSDSNST